MASDPQPDAPAGAPDLAALRAALERGEYDVVLVGCEERLADPDLDRVAADELAVLGAAARDAIRTRLIEARARGQASVAARWLGVLARIDPEAADARERSLAADFAPDPPAADLDPPVPADDDPGEDGLPAPPVGARLALDEAGVFLLLRADRVALEPAPLRALAVGAPGLVVERRRSLRGGPAWSARIERGRAWLDGAPLDGEGARWRPGARAVVGPSRREGVGVRLRTTAASHAALLELLAGAECHGARGIVLAADGRHGRARLGRADDALVRTPALRAPLEVEWSGAELVLRSEDGLRRDGADPEPEVRVPWPPTGPVDLTLGRAAAGRPPCWLRLEPWAAPAGRGRGR